MLDLGFSETSQSFSFYRQLFFHSFQRKKTSKTNKIVIFDGKREQLAGKVFDVDIEHCTGHVLYGDPVLD